MGSTGEGHRKIPKVVALAAHEYCSPQQRLRALVTALIKLLFASGRELDRFSGALEVVGSGLSVLSYSPN